MLAVYILIFAAIFSFLTLYSVTPAMIIKTFFDDRIIVNFKRILLCAGIMTGIGILLFMMITENNGKLAAYIFIPLLMIVLLIVMPIIFAYRCGMPKLYYAESLLLFFEVTNVCAVCTMALSYLISDMLLILSITSSKNSRVLGSLISMPVFLLLCL